MKKNFTSSKPHHVYKSKVHINHVYHHAQRKVLCSSYNYPVMKAATLKCNVGQCDICMHERHKMDLPGEHSLLL